MDSRTSIPAVVHDPLRRPWAKPRGSATLAAGVLVFCCILWGYSFPVMQIATRAFDRHMLGAANDQQGGPNASSMLAARAVFNGLRFGVAALLYALITFGRQRNFTRHEVVGGLWIGALFGGGMLLQVTGLRWALPSVSSFLTALAVVFAPLAQALLLRRRVGLLTWCAVGLALVGMMLLSWPKPEALSATNLVVRPPVPLLGETVTVLAAILFTGQILAIDHFGKRADPARLTLLTLATTSALNSTCAGLLDARAAFAPVAWSAILGDKTVWWAVASLVIFSSVVAVHLVNTWQPLLSPATASVIYCTEPLFGTMFSVLLATERLTLLTLLGGVAVLGSVVVVSRYAASLNPPLPPPPPRPAPTSSPARSC